MFLEGVLLDSSDECYTVARWFLRVLVFRSLLLMFWVVFRWLLVCPFGVRVF